jgi:predicted AlkP superfamily phosphohydrolase/phosphomutase
MSSARRRFLVIGLDGGTFDLLDPLMRAGELPFLRSLTERGVRAPLESVYPPKTIPAWYSFATGQDPGGLGIFGFTQPDAIPGKSKLVQTFRPHEAIWDFLSRNGVRVGVLNFPLHSGYPLNGFVIPGMLNEDPVSYPATLKGELEEELGAPYPNELPPYRTFERASWMELATRDVAHRGRAAAILAERERPEFLFVLFRETDRVEHQHWGELSRPVEAIPTDLRQFWRTVDAACHAIDTAFRAGGSPALTLVVSDHGHGRAESDFFTNRWLAANGFLHFRNERESLRRQSLSRLAFVVQRFPRIEKLIEPIADILRGGPVREKFGSYITGASSFEAVAQRIDWERTLAYSYPVPEGIYLNLRNPSLTPHRAAEVLQDIRGKLEAYPDARIEVLDPQQIYQGKNLASAPSLFVRIDGLRTDPRMDFSYPQPLLRERPTFFYGTGTHRMLGILIAAGDGVLPQRLTEPLSLLDVAPTVLEGMGVAVPKRMSGRSFARRIGSAA